VTIGLAAGLQISNTCRPGLTVLKRLSNLDRLGIIICHVVQAPIAEVVSVLAVIKVFKVAGSNSTYRQHLVFFLHVVKVRFSILRVVYG